MPEVVAAAQPGKVVVANIGPLLPADLGGPLLDADTGVPVVAGARA